MSQSQLVKTVHPGVCPHCSKDFVISMRSVTPGVDWVLKKETLDELKATLIKRIGEVEFENDVTRDEVVAWVKGDQVAFGPEELEFVIENIKREYGVTKKD